MTDVAEKFGDWIKEGFDIYKNNLAVLILASLVAFIISGLTIGILGGPMFAGLIGIVLKLRDKAQPPPTVGDLFQGFQYFLPSFLFTFVWGFCLMVGLVVLNFIPCLGFAVSLCLALAVSTSLMFGLFLIVDQKMDFWTASMASFEKVKPVFFPYLGLSLVASIIGQIGSIACGLGAFATMPIYFCIIAVAYREAFSEAANPPAPPASEPMPPETQAIPEPPKGPQDPTKE